MMHLAVWRAVADPFPACNAAYVASVASFPGVIYSYIPTSAEVVERLSWLLCCPDRFFAMTLCGTGVLPFLFCGWVADLDSWVRLTIALSYWGEFLALFCFVLFSFWLVLFFCFL